MRVLQRGIQPAFSGKCPLQVNQVSITETMLDEAREECNRKELRRCRLKEENRLSEAQLWSATEKRGHLLKELGSLRHQRAQSLAQAAQPVTSEPEQETLRGGMQIFVKTSTGKTTTFDDEGQ